MAQETTSRHDRIVIDPQILLGKPTVRGTRIPVELVLAHLAEHPDLGDLFAAYPRLTTEDVKACLTYARHAVAEKGQRLTRERQQEALAAAAGALKDADYPEWETPEQTSQWVHDLRRAADEHTSKKLGGRSHG